MKNIRKMDNGELTTICINFTTEDRKSLSKVRAEVQRRIDDLQRVLNICDNWHEEATNDNPD